VRQKQDRKQVVTSSEFCMRSSFKNRGDLQKKRGDSRAPEKLRIFIFKTSIS